MQWKNNAPYALCLTHDVDRIKKQWYHYCVYGLKHPIVQLKSLYEKIKGNEPYWNFEALTTLEEGYNIKSTFLFLNETHKELSANFMGRYNIRSSRVQAIIRELDNRGYEIGLHGSYYSYNNKSLLEEEKDVLESILGHKVLSTRQHHLNLDGKVTWEAHESIGIKYDSTMGCSDRVGTDQPFRTKEGIIEIPITLMDTVNFTDDVFEECCSLADEGGLVMLNFHQCHFNETEYPDNVNMYKRLLDKAKHDGAWITNMKDVGEWLDERL